MTTEAGIRARESINRLLLSAGYFRVRMADLEDFDRIAGGLAWCLKAASVDVDIDIFFKEKPTVGEKVRISESICNGLRLAKCPLELKPHQIQGLDFPYLFPIFQWLVKNVIEVRNEFGDFQRSFAEFSFKNNYAELPVDILKFKNSNNSEKNIRHMEHIFPPKRFYKRSAWNSNLNELKQIETTLLEYGRIPSLVTAEGQKKAKTQKQLEEAEAKQNQRDEELRETLSSMKRQTEADEIDGSMISSSLAAQANTILTNQSIFDDSQTLSANVTEAELAEQHAAQIEKVNARLAAIKAEGKRISGENDDLDEQLANARKAYADAQKRNQELRGIIAECQKIVDQAEHTEAILNAITLRDDNQKNIELFQQQCKEEIAEWQEKIEAVKAKAAGSGDTNALKLAAALEQHQRDWDRMQELVAERARELLKLRTEYDIYPTMAELSQYSRRLKELSALSLSKLTEVKKCQQLLNSLISSTNILEQENKLFNEVLSTFSQAITQKDTQQNLIHQLVAISAATGDQSKKIEAELAHKNQDLQTLEEKHRKLLEKQRRYFQAVKEYQEAQDQLAELLDDEEGGNDDYEEEYD